MNAIWQESWRDWIKTIGPLKVKIIFNEPMLRECARWDYPDDTQPGEVHGGECRLSLSQCAVLSLSCVICFQSILQIAMRLLCVLFLFRESPLFINGFVSPPDASKDRGRLSIRSTKKIIEYIISLSLQICIGSVWQSFDLVWPSWSRNRLRIRLRHSQLQLNSVSCFGWLQTEYGFWLSEQCGLNKLATSILKSGLDSCRRSIRLYQRLIQQFFILRPKLTTS